ncbi:MAG: hypothetical protein ABSG03_33130 [Bryobacteraceae bacterium]
MRTREVCGDADANSFFNNASRTPRPPYHRNQYGVTPGAPVIIPKVYNGENKVFWFFAWEGMRDSDPANSPAETGSPVNFATVPTAAERTVDFSAFLQLGTVIYNQYSATQIRLHYQAHSLSQKHYSQQSAESGGAVAAAILSIARQPQCEVQWLR